MTCQKNQKGQAKTARIPIKIAPQPIMKKPAWIRVKTNHSTQFQTVKRLLRQQELHTVCEEASCPNIAECFSSGTATFMILGDLCTRRCPFCDVAHGRPQPPNGEEPERLARSIATLQLNYVVITSVDRDDLRDGGASHFAACVTAIRRQSPATRIEILVPDFRGRQATALDALGTALPDIFNHNVETVPRLYRQARPGADYNHSLQLLSAFRQRYPSLPTKSGLMVGLGENDEEILSVMRDLRENNVEMLTIGQYLQPSRHHLPVRRFVEPVQFDHFAYAAKTMGFTHAACGPLVRSSYHAESQARNAGIPVMQSLQTRLV